MADAPDILLRIVAEKQRELEDGRLAIPLSEMQRRAESRADIPRGFADRIVARVKSGKPAVIAELKKASPSKGIIRSNFKPAEIACDYAAAGATCLSVLTDRPFFQGCNDYLVQARSVCSLPVLRKDFIIDSYQVYEASAIGADCILLIVAILDADSLRTLSNLALELGLDTLIEVHNAEELEIALSLSPRMIGINNRNLHTFSVSLDTTIDLLNSIPENVLVISESGIASRADVKRLRDGGVSGFLVGESLMSDPDPGHRLKLLFSRESTK